MTQTQGGGEWMILRMRVDGGGDEEEEKRLESRSWLMTKMLEGEELAIRECGRVTING